MTTPSSPGSDPGNGVSRVGAPAGGRRTSSQAVRRAIVWPPRHVRCGAGASHRDLGAHGWGQPVEKMDHEHFKGTSELRDRSYGALGQCLAKSAAQAESESPRLQPSSPQPDRRATQQDASQ